MKNYRTVREEQQLELTKGLTIVGPNNTGKTNLLRGIQLLFTGRDNELNYDIEKDRTFGVGRKQTSLTATFSGDPSADDQGIFEPLDELHELQGTERNGDTSFSLNLYFTESSTPVYRFFPNTKRPKGSEGARYSRTERNLVADLLGRFSCHYVPSNKRFGGLYEDLVVSFLKESVAEVLEPYEDEIDDVLAGTGRSVTDALHEFGLEDLEVSLNIPDEQLQSMIRGFEIHVSDPSRTPLAEKGMGVQAAVILASFLWVTREEQRRGQEVLWLIEEPEAFLHPELAGTCNQLLRNLARKCSVVTSTHSLRFVPQDPARVVGTRIEDAATRVDSYPTYRQATEEIRRALGVRFSDYYNLDWYTVFVEGKTDRQLIEWILETIPPDTDLAADVEWPSLRHHGTRFPDMGGVKPLEGFLKAVYEHIRDEIPAVVLLDGDEAGERTRSALQGYFGNKEIPFRANYDFVVTRDRFPIEGLFPDEWVIDIQQEHENWFYSHGTDPQGNLLPFRVNDSYKEQFQSALVGRADATEGVDWAGQWIELMTSLETALNTAEMRLVEDGLVHQEVLEFFAADEDEEQ